jgi:hypothetical protein
MSVAHSVAMRYLSRPARALAEERMSTLSFRQLVDLGVPEVTIHTWRKQGVLIPIFRGQYRIGGSAMQELQAVIAALQRSGDGARVAGPWALALHGVDGFEIGGTRQITVPPQRRVRNVPFTVVRSPVPEVDQTEVLGLPTVTIERALIDSCTELPRSKIRAAYYDAKRSGRCDGALLAARASDLGRVPGAAQMRAIVTSGALDLESEGEWDFISTVFRPGDPLPVPQVVVAWRDRTFRLDFAYLEGRIDLEFDSRLWHEDRFEQDRDRDLAMAELQIQPLRITRGMLRDPVTTRRRILAVRDQRLALGLPPIVPLNRGATPR